MGGDYLNLLDAMLADGLARCRPAYLDRHVAFIAACQRPDGGFPGRRGGSDPYYTDFAARVLALCAPGHPALARVEHYLAELPPPDDLIGLFNRLNIARQLRLSLDLPPYRRLWQRFTAPRASGIPQAYHLFLAALCAVMLDLPSPFVGSIQPLHALRCPDGGFSEGTESGQTNATTAVLAIMAMAGAGDADTRDSALSFLAGMQAGDGGLRAHPDVPDGDLLSTFTGLLTLASQGGVEQLNLAAVARFAGRLETGAGGFRGSMSDDAPDCEYTYYGLATVALLRTLAEG